MNYTKIQTDIINGQSPLRLKGVLKKRKETLKEFIIKFFTDFNDTKSTIYVANGSEQTEPGRRRSIGDTFLICRYYYPTCTLEEVSNIIYNNLFGEIPNFRSSYCNVIHKRVFYVGNENQESQVFNAQKKDEYGLILSDWTSRTDIVDGLDDGIGYDEDDDLYIEWNDD